MFSRIMALLSSQPIVYDERNRALLGSNTPSFSVGSPRLLSYSTLTLPIKKSVSLARSLRCFLGFFFIFGFGLIKHGRDLCHEQGMRPSDVRHRGLTLYRQAPGSRRVSLSPSGRVHVYIHVQHLQHQQLYQYPYHQQ